MEESSDHSATRSLDQHHSSSSKKPVKVSDTSNTLFDQSKESKRMDVSYEELEREEDSEIQSEKQSKRRKRAQGIPFSPFLILHLDPSCRPFLNLLFPLAPKSNAARKTMKMDFEETPHSVHSDSSARMISEEDFASQFESESPKGDRKGKGKEKGEDADIAKEVEDGMDLEAEYQTIERERKAKEKEEKEKAEKQKQQEKQHSLSSSSNVFPFQNEAMQVDIINEKERIRNAREVELRRLCQENGIDWARASMYPYKATVDQFLDGKGALLLFYPIFI